MNSNSVRDGQPQHSNQPSNSPSYDLQAIKRPVGLAPFAQRVQLSSDGFCACPFHSGDSDKSFHVVQKKMARSSAHASQPAARVLTPSNLSRNTMTCKRAKPSANWST